MPHLASCPAPRRSKIERVLRRRSARRNVRVQHRRGGADRGRSPGLEVRWAVWRQSISFDASCTYPEGKRKAVDNLTLSVADGEFLVLLGPSGCGKTTALRMLAGLEELQTGQVLVDGQDLDGIPPGERDLAMVFQSYALFPHMTVARNLGFRMELSGAPPSAVSRRVRRDRGGAEPDRPAGPAAQDAVRRRAAARGDRPRDGARAAGVPDGRAARRAGREAADVGARADRGRCSARAASRRCT